MASRKTENNIKQLEEDQLKAVETIFSESPDGENVIQLSKELGVIQESTIQEINEALPDAEKIFKEKLSNRNSTTNSEQQKKQLFIKCFQEVFGKFLFEDGPDDVKELLRTKLEGKLKNKTLEHPLKDLKDRPEMRACLRRLSEINAENNAQEVSQEKIDKYDEEKNELDQNIKQQTNNINSVNNSISTFEKINYPVELIESIETDYNNLNKFKEREQSLRTNLKDSKNSFESTFTGLKSSSLTLISKLNEELPTPQNEIKNCDLINSNIDDLFKLLEDPNRYAFNWEEKLIQNVKPLLENFNEENFLKDHPQIAPEYFSSELLVMNQNKEKIFNKSNLQVTKDIQTQHIKLDTIEKDITFNSLEKSKIETDITENNEALENYNTFKDGKHEELRKKEHEISMIMNKIVNIDINSFETRKSNAKNEHNIQTNELKSKHRNNELSFEELEIEIQLLTEKLQNKIKEIEKEKNEYEITQKEANDKSLEKDNIQKHIDETIVNINKIEKNNNSLNENLSTLSEKITKLKEDKSNTENLIKQIIESDDYKSYLGSVENFKTSISALKEKMEKLPDHEKPNEIELTESMLESFKNACEEAWPIKEEDSDFSKLEEIFKNNRLDEFYGQLSNNFLKNSPYNSVYYSKYFTPIYDEINSIHNNYTNEIKPILDQHRSTISQITDTTNKLNISRENLVTNFDTIREQLEQTKKDQLDTPGSDSVTTNIDNLLNQLSFLNVDTSFEDITNYFKSDYYNQLHLDIGADLNTNLYSLEIDKNAEQEDLNKVTQILERLKSCGFSGINLDEILSTLETDQDLEDSEVAKKIYTEILRKRFPKLTENELNQLATLTLMNDLDKIQTDDTFREIAETGDTRMLDIIQIKGFKEKLINMQFKVGKKIIQPLKRIKPEELDSPEKISKLFRNGKIDLNNGFYLLSGIEKFQGKNSYEYIEIKKQLKLLLSKQLNIEDKLHDSKINQILNEEIDRQISLTEPLVKDYFDHYDMNIDKVNQYKISELNKRFEILKAELRSNKINEKEFKTKMLELREEASESGIEGLTDFQQNDTLTRYWNSSEAQWLRDKGYDLGSYLLRKSKSLASIGLGIIPSALGGTINFATRGLWETTKLSFQGSVGIAKLPFKAIWGTAKRLHYPLMLAAAPLVWGVNLFRSNPWKPFSISETIGKDLKNGFKIGETVNQSVKGAKDALSSSANNVGSSFSGNTSSFIEDTKEISKKEWSNEQWKTTNYESRNKENIEKIRAQILELKKQSKILPVKTTRLPRINIKKLKEKLNTINQ